MENIKIKLDLTSYQKANIKLFLRLLQENLGSVSFKLIGSPVKRKLFTVLQSPHVYKKSREQFEVLQYREKVIIDYQAKHSAIKNLGDLESFVKHLGSNCNLLIRVKKIF